MASVEQSLSSCSSGDSPAPKLGIANNIEVQKLIGWQTSVSRLARG